MFKKLTKYLITLGFITIIALILFETVIMPFYVRQGKSKKLIDVTSLDVRSALIMIRTSGFRGVVSDTIYTDQVEPNTVLDQYPKPGSIVKKKRTVRLKVSQSEKMVKVPYIIGQSQRSAEISLKKLGLKIGSVSQDYSQDYPAGVIIDQMPDSMQSIPKGYNVRVIISQGRSPNDILVPSLFGLSKEAADIELGKAGLKIGKIHYKQNEDLIPYTVLDQSIPSGTILEEPELIDITVSVLDLQDIFQDLTN
jgi:serine/threonine-protein kinase